MRLLSRRHRLFVLAFIFLAVAARAPEPVAAHPLGNFSVNTYSCIELGSLGLSVRYVVDMAEIPAFQEQSRIDGDGNGTLTPAEQSVYLEAQAAALLAKLRLEVNGRATPLQLVEHHLEFPAGQGGLKTLRLTLLAQAALEGTSGWSVAFYDDNYPDRLGWREIVVRPGEDVHLITSTVSTEDASGELREYPEELLQSPMAVRQATFHFTPIVAVDRRTGVTMEAAPAGNALPAPGFGQDHFAELITAPIVGPAGLVVALLLALGWGALHAFSPGHGKTIVAAYLVGTRGTARHALFLGLTTTTTHTVGVFALGFIVLMASQFILPEQLYPWLGVASGILVVAIGLSLLRQRLRSFRKYEPAARRLQFPELHHHSSPGQDHEHEHHDGHSHSHDHDPTHHHSSHDHDHHHGHSHLPPGGDGAEVTWRSLAALGISGGLVPCPSALVMMLGAIALGRVGLGLVLIVAFSVGLAGVLTAVGLAMVYAGRLFESMPGGAGRGAIIRLVSAGSALMITLTGVVITAKALLDTGLL